jgi:hypothetical protein
MVRKLLKMGPDPERPRESEIWKGTHHLTQSNLIEGNLTIVRPRRLLEGQDV